MRGAVSVKPGGSATLKLTSGFAGAAHLRRRERPVERLARPRELRTKMQGVFYTNSSFTHDARAAGIYASETSMFSVPLTEGRETRNRKLSATLESGVPLDRNNSSIAFWSSRDSAAVSIRPTLRMRDRIPPKTG